MQWLNCCSGLGAVYIVVHAHSIIEDVTKLVYSHQRIKFEYKKINNMHRRKQRRRSAVQLRAFGFASQKVFLFYLYSKFLDSNLLLRLYIPVRVGPGREPELLVFSCVDSFHLLLALNILKMESLMSLARELTFSEGSKLGRQLGVKQEKILQIKDDSEKDPVAANFRILCQWRGR